MRSAKVVPRGCSRPLQRAIVDFAADQSFALARMKLLEHYGFEIGESAIQRVALGHAKTVFEAGGSSQDFPQTVGRHKEIVAQTDGGMIPIVEPDASQKDKRKGKTLSWREAKICLAHAKGSQTPVYDGTIEGGVETAGRKLFACAVRAGFGATSHVHAVGDGAPWIVGQVERMNAQKEALKTGRLDQALAALAGHIEAPEVDDDQAPVRRRHRYLSGRRNHLNYYDALANDLPIGSGEIESAHRYIAQQRLKRPGAWWRVDHAEYMLALRINRRNGDWAAYWATFGKTASPANQNRPAGSRKSAA